MEKVKNKQKPETGLVFLTAKVSPELKELITKFGVDTKRTTSAATFYLLENHPEIVNLKNTGVEQS